VNYRGPELYFQVYRDGKKSLDKWRTELAEEEQRRVIAIARQTAPGALWPDFALGTLS
jgi:hypothetical protein